MEDKIIEEMEKSMNGGVKEEYPYFKDSGYIAHKIVKENFHLINSCEGKICFIDGGNSEVFSSANISLSFIRICSVIYDNNKKIDFKKYEFYVLVKVVNENGLVFKTKIFDSGLGLKDLIFDIDDETIRNGIQKAEIGSVAGVIRKFGELKLMGMMVGFLHKGDVIVRDGSLQCAHTFEKDFFDEIYFEGCEKGVNIVGLSKTTRMLTNSGNSLPYVLGKRGLESCWYYHPVVEINNQSHKADIYFAKLHPKSGYIFRLDVFNGLSYDIGKILGLLVSNSTDSVFLGYPYGLIEVDQLCRVSNHERDYMKTKLMIKMKDGKVISDLMNSVNAHGILDNIS